MIQFQHLLRYLRPSFLLASAQPLATECNEWHAIVLDCTRFPTDANSMSFSWTTGTIGLNKKCTGDRSQQDSRLQTLCDD